MSKQITLHLNLNLCLTVSLPGSLSLLCRLPCLHFNGKNGVDDERV